MVKTVVREYHWTIDKIKNLYLDDADFFGLVFWYEDIKELDKQLKAKNG